MAILYFLPPCPSPLSTDCCYPLLPSFRHPLRSSINHVVKFLGIFYPFPPFVVTLLNKAYVIKLSSPYPQLSTWFIDVPFPFLLLSCNYRPFIVRDAQEFVTSLLYRFISSVIFTDHKTEPQNERACYAQKVKTAHPRTMDSIRYAHCSTYHLKST